MPFERILLVAALASSCGGSSSTGPSAPRTDYEEVLHGVTLADPYHWLEDLSSPDTRNWIAQENAYSSEHFARLEGRHEIAKRLGELLKIDRITTPIERGGRYFFSKRAADDDLWSIYYRDGLGAQDMLLDVAEFGDDQTTSVSLMEVSPDGKLAAYAVRRSGRDEVEIRIRDIDRGEDLPDRLPSGLYSGLAFTGDTTAFFYARRDRDGGSRVYRRRLDSEEDEEVFGEGYGPDVFLSLSISGQSVLVNAQHGWARNDIWILDVAGRRPPQAIVKDVDALFRPVWAGERLLALQTGWKAPNRRVLLVDLDNPAQDQWREIVPESEDAIQAISVIDGRLFVNYLHNVATRIRVFKLDGESAGAAPLPALSSASVSGRWNSPDAFLSTSSLADPGQVMLYDASTGDRRVWFEPQIPVDPEQFETKQVWRESKDGTRAPMFLVHKKGLELDGRRPVLLTGYGGFNVSRTPVFTPNAVLWAENDGVFALATLRGGGEFGDEWHRGGMLENKQNVFDDFISAAEWLIDNGVTTPDRLAIEGRSNGGLLVGAAVTQRPDLFRAVLCGYPDLDMVRYWRYKENNNPPALLEYGDGSKPEHFEFLRRYSPYERIEQGADYPAVLFTTGEGDTRVPPQQALKMTAKLRWATSSERPILLRFDTKSGHAGGRPLSVLIEHNATEQAFLFDQIGAPIMAR